MLGMHVVVASWLNLIAILGGTLAVTPTSSNVNGDTRVYGK